MDSNHYITSGMVEQYVLGLCTASEKAEIEQLRITDPALNEAILNFELQFENEMLQHATLPHHSTDDKILSTLRALAQAPSAARVVMLQTDKTPLYSIKKLRKWAIAASILFGVSMLVNVIQYFNKEKAIRDLQANTTNKGPVTLPLTDYNILKDPTITPIAMYGVGSHSICRCTMFWDKKTGNVYIMLHHLPKSSEVKDYQLWANVDGKQISVGIINDAIRDRFIEMNNMPAGATSFIVTLEKAGGTSVPTESEIYLKGDI